MSTQAFDYFWEREQKTSYCFQLHSKVSRLNLKHCYNFTMACDLNRFLRNRYLVSV